jgi:hypothetical protein
MGTYFVFNQNAHKLNGLSNSLQHYSLAQMRMTFMNFKNFSFFCQIVTAVKQKIKIRYRKDRKQFRWFLITRKTARVRRNQLHLGSWILSFSRTWHWKHSSGTRWCLIGQKFTDGLEELSASILMYRVPPKLQEWTLLHSRKE